MTPPKIIFVLLHSAFHTPKCWDRLSAEIEEAGFSSVAPALPSSIPGSTVPVSGWDEDVKAIRETVSSLVRESDVVVVMHGTRGLSGGTALEGLDKQSRMSQGLQGGVIRLVYIASYPMREWFQHRILGYNTPGNGPYPVPSVFTLPADRAKSMFYQDMDDETVAELAKDLVPLRADFEWFQTTHAAWRDIPTTCILCLQDRPEYLAVSRYLLDVARASGRHQIDNVIEVDAGSCPFISRPQWTCEAIIRTIFDLPPGRA